MEPDTGTVTLSKTLDMIFIDQQRSLMAPEKRVREVPGQGATGSTCAECASMCMAI